MSLEKHGWIQEDDTVRHLKTGSVATGLAAQIVIKHLEHKRWRLRTEETIMVERCLRQAGFTKVCVRRDNAACISVHIIDDCFTDKTRTERFNLVQPVFDQLPEAIQQDLIRVVLVTYAEYVAERGVLPAVQATPRPHRHH